MKMKRLKVFFRYTFIMLGAMNLGYVFASIRYGDIVNIKALYALDALMVTAAVSAELILKTGVSPVEKWIRRAVLLLVDTVAAPTYFVIFGWIKAEALMKTLPYSVLFLLAVPVIALIIGDIWEKKHIERINKKLSQNIEND